jgi:uncharacterized OB-fold protein
VKDVVTAPPAADAVREPKPVPFPRGEEQGWFDAARDGRLLYQQCADCGAVPSYPRAACPSCWSSALAEKTSAGRGVVHSFTTQHRPGGRGFAADVPYTLVLVDLDEGFRVLADLRDGPQGTVAVGLPVEAIFEEAAPGLALPRFRPASRATR